MNKSVIVILGIIVLAGIGWYLWGSGADIQSPASTQKVDVEDRLAILLEQNESGESGTATIAEVEGGVMIFLRMIGAPEGVLQPAHIHKNSCPDIGEVLYPLTAVVNGFSETMLEVSLTDLLVGLPLSVNVHKSAEEVSEYIACGDIVL